MGTKKEGVSATASRRASKVSRQSRLMDDEDIPEAGNTGGAGQTLEREKVGRKRSAK